MKGPVCSTLLAMEDQGQVKLLAVVFLVAKIPEFFLLSPQKQEMSQAWDLILIVKLLIIILSNEDIAKTIQTSQSVSV